MMNRRWNKRYRFVDAREASRGTKWPSIIGSTSIRADDRVTRKASINGVGSLGVSRRFSDRSTVIIVHRASILIVSALVSLVIIRSGWWPVSGSGSAKCEHNLDRAPRWIRYYRSIREFPDQPAIREDTEYHVRAVHIPSIDQVVLWPFSHDRFVRIDSVHQVVA